MFETRVLSGMRPTGSLHLGHYHGVLNLLPILPLDGGRVLASLLPLRLARSYARLERVGLLAVLLLLSQTSILSTLVGPVLRSFLSLAAGTR